MRSYSAARHGAVIPFACSVYSVGSAAKRWTAVVNETKANVNREVVSDSIMRTLMAENKKNELLGFQLGCFFRYLSRPNYCANMASSTARNGFTDGLMVSVLTSRITLPLRKCVLGTKQNEILVGNHLAKRLKIARQGSHS